MSDQVIDFTTIGDFIRLATTRFNQAGLAFSHGVTDAIGDAVFLVLETLNLPIDQAELLWPCKLTATERALVLSRIEARVKTGKPSAYLVNKAYIHGVPFYVDERVIVPRSFIGELLFSDTLSGLLPPSESVHRVLDLCTGSGCLAILAAEFFPQAQIDAVDLSPDALEVAKRNLVEHELTDRINLFQGDLFAPLAGKKYDLILTNPPYVEEWAMTNLPPEYAAEPRMALVSGADGMDIVRKIIAQAPTYLTPGGGMLCELGRGKPVIDRDYPDLTLTWLDTTHSAGEVFWWVPDAE